MPKMEKKRGGRGGKGEHHARSADKLCGTVQLPNWAGAY